MSTETKEQIEKDWQEWLAERPPAVRELAEKYGPFDCFKVEGGGHYKVIAYDEQKSGPITLRLVHGRDSFLPGIAVFGIEPNEVELCGCGNWEAPTQEQIDYVNKLCISLEGIFGIDTRQDYIREGMKSCPK